MSGGRARKGTAICIGIDEYCNYPQLRSAVSDAKAVSETMRSFGFHVTVLVNPTHAQVIESLSVLKHTSDLVSDPQDIDVVMLYFAGHGESRSGNEVLLLQDACVDTDVGVLSLDEVLSELSVFVKSRGALIACMDACRDRLDQPYIKTSSKLQKRHQQYLILFACSPGNKALEDGSSSCGYLTKHLLAELSRHPTEPVRTIVDRARLLVVQDTFGRQRPWIETNMTDAISLDCNVGVDTVFSRSASSATHLQDHYKIRIQKGYRHGEVFNVALDAGSNVGLLAKELATLLTETTNLNSPYYNLDDDPSRVILKVDGMELQGESVIPVDLRKTVEAEIRDSSTGSMRRIVYLRQQGLDDVADFLETLGNRKLIGSEETWNTSHEFAEIVRLVTRLTIPEQTRGSCRCRDEIVELFEVLEYSAAVSSATPLTVLQALVEEFG